ncbi:MAG: TlpA disulfide reductase family protein [Candidatus Wallbacteria bacterium]|nr:TlpA disulfide reductase family protein [Candidatus Wallbacteria bacterium]
MEKRQRAIVILLLLTGMVLTVFHIKIKQLPDAGAMKSGIMDQLNSYARQGQYFPEARIRLLSGESLDITESIGKKVIIINFFASWCPPCKSELPDFEKYFEKLRDKPVLFIGISLDQEKDRKALDSVLAESGVTYPVGFPEIPSIAEKVNVKSIPVTVLINILGKVSSMHVGAINPETLGKEIDANLRGLERGLGISRDDYLTRLAKQTLENGGE